MSFGYTPFLPDMNRQTPPTSPYGWEVHTDDLEEESNGNSSIIANKCSPYGTEYGSSTIEVSLRPPNPVEASPSSPLQTQPTKESWLQRCFKCFCCCFIAHENFKDQECSHPLQK